MDRRLVLKSLGLAAAGLGSGGLLAACARGSASGIPAGEATLSVVNASFETLVGDGRRVNLVVTNNDRSPVDGVELATYVRTLEGEVRSGPHPATWHDEATEGTGTGLGLYQTTVPLPEAGTLEIVAVTGDRFGTVAVNVVDPADALAPVPGAPAVSTPTPTTAAALGFSQICTQQPPCGMHELSLDQALDQGRPVVVLFATPAYCQSAICAPSVGNLEAVRSGGTWGDTVFVHCEIYTENPSENPQALAPPVQAWNLPSEPWLFTVDAQGVIVDRLDGPMLRADMRRVAEQLA